MRKEDCIFCKIAAGEIPSRTLFENERFRVIMDIEPATKGHALILPKNHYDDLFELGDEETKEIMCLAQKIARQMKEKLGCEGLNLVQNNGEVANQTVKHYHLHLIPRYSDDCNRDKFDWNHEDISSEQMDEIFSRLQK